nr:NAD(P)H-binding protein [Allomuricauda sp.]
MKRVLLAGASGMIGELILKECLSSSKVETIVSLVRRKSNLSHPKLQETIIDDFSDYSNHQVLFQNVDAAFFCIGVYTGQVPKQEFRRITVDYAVSFAEALKSNSPNANFCLLSGAGADRTEKSKTAFAKFKGIAENKISNMDIKFYSFRPGYIYPVTPRKEPNFMYRISRAFYPIIKLLGKNASIKSTELANAMFKVGMNGGEKEILENRDILDIVYKKV